MAARDLSTALMAMDMMLSEADTTINGGRTEPRLNVKASFKTGCFKIDFSSFQDIATKFKDLLAGQTSTALANAGGIVMTVVGLVQLIKWIAGRKITHFELVTGRVNVYVGDAYLSVERHVLDLYRNHKLKEAMQRAIFEPLNKVGIDSFAIVMGDKVMADVSKDDAQYFQVPQFEKMQLDDTTITTYLNIVSPSFEAGYKWRVNDGASNFLVSILDQDFIDRVLRAEIIFTASTTLKVLLREIQTTDTKGVLQKERDVQKVLEIIRPHEQMDFTLISG